MDMAIDSQTMPEGNFNEFNGLPWTLVPDLSVWTDSQSGVLKNPLGIRALTRRPIPTTSEKADVSF